MPGLAILMDLDIHTVLVMMGLFPLVLLAIWLVVTHLWLAP